MILRIITCRANLNVTRLNIIKRIAILTFASICAACGGGSGNGGSLTFSTTFAYVDSPTWPRFRSFVSQSPVPLGVAVSGEHFVVSAGSLTPGLTLSSSTGIVSGVSTMPGNYSATITLTRDGYTGSGSAAFTQTIDDLVLQDDGVTTISLGSNFTISAGTLYGGAFPLFSDLLAPNGVSVSYQMAGASVLPSGLTLNPSTGVISGLNNLAAGKYSNIQFEAVVSYQGSSYLYISPVKTLTVI